jgi:electron transfer flavoprotein alpha subunit
MAGAACWVVTECPQGKILRESLEAVSVGLTFQKQYRMETAVLWTGTPVEDAQLEYLASLGVTRVTCLDGRENGADREDALLFGLKNLYLEYKPQYVFFGASPLSLSLAPRLAALLDVGYVARTTYLRRVGDTLSLTRSLMQGALSEVLRFVPPTHGVASLYPRSFDVPSPSGGRPPEKLVPETYDLSCPKEGSRNPEVIERTLEPAAFLEVEDAEVVVAGGKGMGSEEGFSLLQELAGCLGGAVAASRIAVDLGWAPKERLVGQTGKKVFPELYIACGISGAHQHQAGMKDARHILAINTDPQAPIFQIATWGILGDAQQVVGEMIEQLKESNIVVTPAEAGVP